MYIYISICGIPRGLRCSVPPSATTRLQQPEKDRFPPVLFIYLYLYSYIYTCISIYIYVAYLAASAAPSPLSQRSICSSQRRKGPPVLYIYLDLYTHIYIYTCIYKHICVWHTLRPPPLRSPVHNALFAAAIEGPLPSRALYLFRSIYLCIHVYMYIYNYICMWHTLRPPLLLSPVHNALFAAAIEGPLPSRVRSPWSAACCPEER